MIDKLSPTPLYVQVADDVQRQIDDGTYPPGQAIPGEKYMEQHYEVARGTVRRAVVLLVERGLVIKLQGRGTFVLPRP